MIVVLILMLTAAFPFIIKPAKAQEPRMWANPEVSTATVYSPPQGSNPRWNISIMVENLLNCLSMSCNVKSTNNTAAIVTNYYKGADLIAMGLSWVIGLWNSTGGDVQDLTAFTSEEAFTISTPKEIFKIEVEAKAFNPSVTIDIYDQYAGDVNNIDLLDGDCPWDNTVRMTAINTNTITFDSINYNVVTTSNSTVSGITFDQPGMAINITVTGEAGTHGYVNVTIPKSLLNATLAGWDVILDDATTTYTASENATHTFIYFSYTHSQHSVRIVGTWVVPEFPSTTILFTLLTALAVVFALVRKIHKKPWQTL